MWVSIKIAAGGLSSYLWNVCIIKHESYTCNKCNQLQYKKERSFGMHNYGDHKAYLAVLCRVFCDLFPQTDVPSFNSTYPSLNAETKKFVSVKHANIQDFCVSLPSWVSPFLPRAPVVFSRSLSLWSAAPEWLWEAAGAWWPLDPNLSTASSLSPVAPAQTNSSSKRYFKV